LLAQSRSDQRARRPQPGKLARNTALHDEVQARLLDEHSPEQIAARLRIDFPDDAEMWVSPETIYRSLYVQGKGVCVGSCTPACVPGGRCASLNGAPIRVAAASAT
jgi:IS30 family transposase